MTPRPSFDFGAPSTGDAAPAVIAARPPQPADAVDAAATADAHAIVPGQNGLTPTSGGPTRSRGQFHIPFTDDQVTASIASLPQAQREAVWWFYAHGRDRRLGMGTLAASIRKDSNTLWKVFDGSYGARLDNIVAEIQAFRAVTEARGQIGRPEFIETKLARLVWDVCEAALAYHRIAPLYGDGQVGKTEALKEMVARRGARRIHYLRLPSKLSYGSLVRKAAQVTYAPLNGTLDRIKLEVFGRLDEQSLLIVDELQQVCLIQGATDQLAVLEFFKEIFDETHASLVLCGTSESRALLETSGIAEWLRQLRRRALKPVVLPAIPPAADLRAFAAHFGITEAPEGKAAELVAQVIETDGLGLFITYLQAAKKGALAVEEAISWKHFVTAHAQFAKLGQTRKAGSVLNGEEGR